MKIFYAMLFSIIVLAKLSAQTIIKMEKANGIFVMPCKVNELPLKFIFDTGASDVSISLTEAMFMLKNGYLKESDLIGTQYYQIANGDIQEGTKIVLRQIEVGKLKLYNVKASVVHSLSAPLLLGQSALSKLGKIEFDYSNNTLKIINGQTEVVERKTSSLNSKKQTAEEYINSGRKKVSLKDYQGGIEDFTNAIELNPSSDTAFTNRGICKYNLGDYQGGIKDINKAIELNPKMYKAYCNRGICKYKLEDYYGAMQDLNITIGLSANFDLTYYYRGRSKHALKDYKEAILDYSKTIELNSKFTDAYFNRGACKYGLKDKEGACLDWSKAGELGSTDAYERISKYCK